MEPHRPRPLRPRQDALPADGPPREGRLRGLPRAWARRRHEVPGHFVRVLRELPQGPARRPAGQRLRDLPYHAGFQRIQPGQFDHSRTGFSLLGEHAEVKCDSCHRPGRPRPLRHARCTDCHQDRHAGQLAGRADGGRCETCHDVNGFKPARFSPEDHARTRMPLTGAHLAIPCDACHREVPWSGAGGQACEPGGRPCGIEQFRFVKGLLGVPDDPPPGARPLWTCRAATRPPLVRGTVRPTRRPDSPWRRERRAHVKDATGVRWNAERIRPFNQCMPVTGTPGGVRAPFGRTAGPTARLPRL